MKKLLFLVACISFSFASAQDYNSVISSYLNTNRAQLGLQNLDVQEFEINSQSYSRSMQLDNVYATQKHNGIEIYNSTSSFAIKDGSVVSAGLSFQNNIAEKVNTTNPSITANSAIASAASALGIQSPSNLELLETVSNNAFVFSKGNISLENIPVKLVYQSIENERLRLAWDLSIYLLDASHYYSVRIDAVTGALLNTADWVSNCNFEEANHSHNNVSSLIKENSTAANMIGGDMYRVFAIPLRSPDNGSDTLENGPANATASPFGWHDTDGAAGAEFTITRGNNSYTYLDLCNTGTGPSPDGGATLNFDFPFALPQGPAAYRDASAVNVFYLNNITHDVTYQYGFDEASGNFQENNYGNGGSASDSVATEAQDGGGTNNANFATPPDGQNPRMQMYLWGGSATAVADLLVINGGPLAGSYDAVPAGFGGAIPTMLTGNLVLVEDDDAGPSTDPNDACDNITNAAAINGNIAVLRRGECEFGVKVLAAENAGAIAVIVVNNAAGAPPLMGGGVVGCQATIPAIAISDVDGEPIITQLATASVNATFDGTDVIPSRDGDLDAEIVIHEYTHGISNRLTGGRFNVGCLQNNEQMGEGWSDYIAMVMTIQPGDQAEDIRGLASYSSGNPLGIREAPYSTDFGINDYTYADVNGNVSVPHGVGFVWATMLWEMTWDLIDEHGFDADIYNGTGGNNIAFQLVMDGMKLQNCSPGFVNGRDAILEADRLANAGENQCLIWEAFARRGLGLSASQGSSNSTTDGTEAFDVPTTPGCLVLATRDISLENNFAIYPNPTNGNFNIKTVVDLGDVRISIKDINGRNVYTQNVTLNDTVSINAEGLNSGIYLVQIEGDNYTHTAKLIIE